MYHAKSNLRELPRRNVIHHIFSILIIHSLVPKKISRDVFSQNSRTTFWYSVKTRTCICQKAGNLPRTCHTGMRLVQTCSNCEPSKDPKSGCFNVCYQFTLHIQHCSSCTSHRVHGGIEVPRNPQKYAGGSRHLKEATRGFKWRYPIAGWFISWKIHL